MDFVVGGCILGEPSIKSSRTNFLKIIEMSPNFADILMPCINRSKPLPISPRKIFCVVQKKSLNCFSPRKSFSLSSFLFELRQRQ